MITTDAERDALLLKIEDALRARLSALDIKPGTKKALEMEASFMSGAMCAINALVPASDPEKISPVIPPRWLFAPFRGKSVLDSI